MYNRVSHIRGGAIGVSDIGISEYFFPNIGISEEKIENIGISELKIVNIGIT